MKLFSLLLITFLLTSFGVIAETDDVVKLKQALAKTMPKVKPDKISKSPINGLYEVIIGSQVVYMSVDGRYMIEADMYDLLTKTNITEQTKSIISLAHVNELLNDVTYKDKAGNLVKIKSDNGVIIHFFGLYMCSMSDGCSDLKVLNKLYGKYEKTGFNIIAIDFHSNTNIEDIKVYFADNNLDLPFAVPASLTELSNTFTRLKQRGFKIQAVPTSLFFDHNGDATSKYVGHTSGKTDEYFNMYEERIKKIISKK